MTVGILLLAIVLQGAATWRAFRLVAATRRHAAAVLLAAASVLLALRLFVPLHRALTAGAPAVEAWQELPALLAAASVLAGFLALDPLLRSLWTLNAAVSESESRLEGVIAALAEGVLVRDAQGIIRTCNASAERLLGRPRDRIIGAAALEEERGTLAFSDEHRAALIALHTGEPSSAIATSRRADGTLAWTSINTRPLLHPGEPRPVGVVSSFSDVSEVKHTERVLRDVAEGLSSHTGSAFFGFLVEHLSRDLGMACAVVAEVEPGTGTARTLALWADGAPGAPRSIRLAAAPCDLRARFPVMHAAGVQAAFPGDALVAELRVESYCGVALFDAGGEVLGLLAVMDRKPITEPRRVQAVVQIFAVRAAAELERNRTERRIEEQRVFLRQIIDTSPTLVLARDRTGRVTLVNRTAAEWHGFTVESATGLPYAVLQPGDAQVERYLREDREVLDSGRELVLSEECVKGPAGQPHYFLIVKRPIVGPSGHADQVLIVATDVTERKRAGEALRRTEETYRGIVENTAQGIFQMQPSGRLATANPAFARLLGYASAAELLSYGDDPELLQRHLDAPCLAAIERGFREDAAPRRFVHRVHNVSGATLWVSHRARIVRDAQGAAVSYEGTLEDITQRVLADEAEAELRQRLGKAAHDWQTTFDAIEAPVLVVGFDGDVQRVNRAAQQLTGRDFRDNLGLPVGRLGAGEPWRTAAEAVRSIAAGGAGRSVQVREPRSGTTWDIAASVAGEAGDGRVILVARDISAVIALQESLRRSETMSAMGSLVAGVAHQVRNPLFGISSTVDAFEARFGRDEKFAKYMSVLRGELERLSSLMQELLEYGRPPSDERQPVALADVVAQAVRSCQGQARRAKVRLVTELDEGCGVAAMDRRRVLQVFQNLVENAVQHSRPGDKVTVSGRVERAGDGTWFECTVSDTGPGFPPADLPRLFEPFFTRRRGGTGLGLPIAQRIVEEHGGTIAAGNRPEGGALMRVRLPLAADGVPAPAESGADEETPADRG